MFSTSLNLITTIKPQKYNTHTHTHTHIYIYICKNPNPLRVSRYENTINMCLSRQTRKRSTTEELACLPRQVSKKDEEGDDASYDKQYRAQQVSYFGLNYSFISLAQEIWVININKYPSLIQKINNNLLNLSITS